MTVEINLTPTGTPFEIATEGGAISGRSWGSPSGCRAAFLLVHGLGAHSGWFEALARRLKVKHFYVVAYDQVGYGKRRDQRFTGFQQWLDDASAVYRHLKGEVGEKQVCLLGNSMGGVVATCAAPELKPEKLVLCSPGFAGHAGTFTLPFRLKGLLQAFLDSAAEVELPYGCDLVTRDRSARDWIEADPERRFRVPAKMLLELLKLCRQAPQKSKRITCPTLMLTAGVDKVVDNNAAAEILSRIPGQTRRRHFVEAYHDLMFDPVIDEVAAEVAEWISQEPAGTKVEVQAG